MTWKIWFTTACAVRNNLANYLTRFPQETRIGMLVRGCENRSVNALVVEKQHSRQNLYLIGIPCTASLTGAKWSR